MSIVMSAHCKQESIQYAQVSWGKERLATWSSVPQLISGARIPKTVLLAQFTNYFYRVNIVHLRDK